MIERHRAVLASGVAALGAALAGCAPLGLPRAGSGTDAAKAQRRPKAALYVPAAIGSARVTVKGAEGRVSASVRPGRPFGDSLAEALAKTFEVERVADPRRTRNAEFLISADPGFPEKIAVDIADPATGTKLRRVETQPWDLQLDELYARRIARCRVLMWTVIGGLPCPYWSWRGRRGTRARVDQQVSESLAALAQEIQDDGRLLRFHRYEAKAKTAMRQGDAAGRSGNRAHAFEQYRAALRYAWPGGLVDKAVREKFLRLTSGLKTPPPIPDDSLRQAARAHSLVQEAESEADLAGAVYAMEDAIRLAPWWADAYYNLGLIQEAANQPGEAVQSLRSYLRAAPAASDAKSVQEKIADLEMSLDEPSAPAAKEDEGPEADDDPLPEPDRPARRPRRL